MTTELTPTQKLVLELAAEGKSDKEIARIRGRSIDTIKTNFLGVFKKLNVHNRTSAVAKAIRAGMI